MIHVDIEFSGMIAFDLRQRTKKTALLLSGGDRTEPHLPVIAIPRSAVAKDGVPSALRRVNGWPQALEYGGVEQLLFDLTGVDLLVKGAATTKTPAFKKVWDLGTVNKMCGGEGKIECGGEVGRVVMSGGLLTQGKAYEPFDKCKFALKQGARILKGSIRQLTNTMHWSGDAVSVRVRNAYGDQGTIVLKDSGLQTTKIKMAVYALVSSSGVDKDGLGDFLNFYSLLSRPPHQPASLVEHPETPRLEGFPRCIPPITLV